MTTTNPQEAAGEAATAAPVTAAGLRVPRSSEVVADYLRDQIRRGKLSRGDQLPPERELAKQLGVGRLSVREALRTLSLEGLTTVERGRTGGTRIVTPEASHLASFVEGFIAGNRSSVDSLLEVRLLVEPFCAALAAERRTEEDLVELRAATADLVAAHNNAEDFTQENFTQENFRWHMTVTKASKNELLAAFIIGMAEPLRLATSTGVAAARSSRQEVLNVHDKILEAIEQKDSAAAERRMRRHMAAYISAFTALSERDT